MRLRITPDLEFFVELDLQGVTESTPDTVLQLYKEVVTEEFLKRLRTVFPEDDIRFYNLEFKAAESARKKAA
jgi:hypothetical protein